MTETNVRVWRLGHHAAPILYILRVNACNEEGARMVLVWMVPAVGNKSAPMSDGSTLPQIHTNTRTHILYSHIHNELVLFSVHLLDVVAAKHPLPH